MPAGLEAGSGDGVDACLLERNGFIGCCGHANGDDVFRAAFLQNFFWRNSEDEAEYGHLRVEQHADLILDPNRRKRFVYRIRSSQSRKMCGERRKTSFEGIFVRSSGASVFHRNPQIHCERFGGKRANLCDYVFDCFGCQRVRAERSESAKIGNGSGQPLRGKPAERALNDWVFNTELCCQPVAIPGGWRHADTSKITSSSTGAPSGRLATP